MKRSLKKGLPGGPNEKVFSKEGYRSTSPDVNNLFNFIPSGNITMKEKDGTPLKKGPLLGIDNLGNSKLMLPGANYQFPGDVVKEVPLAKKGGPFQNSNIYATNKLFAKNPLFKKRKKGKKAKGIYNPKAKYTYDDGGESGCPDGKVWSNKFKKCVHRIQHEDYFNSPSMNNYGDVPVISSDPIQSLGDLGPDGLTENILEFFDASGVLSYDDAEKAYGEWQNSKNTYPTFNQSLSMFGAVPALGKLGKIKYLKTGLDKFYKGFDLSKAVYGIIPWQKILNAIDTGQDINEDNINPSIKKTKKSEWNPPLIKREVVVKPKKAFGGEAACPEGFYNDPVKGCVAIEDPSTFYENWYKNRVMPTAEGQKLLEKIRPEALERASQNVPYIYSEELNPNEAGYYDTETQQIFLNKDLPEAQIEATKLHERGHHIQAGDKFYDVLGKPHQYLVEQNVVGPKEIDTGNPEWDKNLKKNYDDVTNPDEIHARIMTLRNECGFKPDQVITEKDIEDCFKRKKEAGEALDPDIEDLKGVTKGNKSIVNLLNDMVSVPTSQDDILYAKNGGAIEIEIDESDIDKYVKGGYVVEDISVPSLSHMDEGGEKRKKRRNKEKNVEVIDSTEQPITPENIEQVIEKPEVEVNPAQERVPLMMQFSNEFQENNPYDAYYEKAAYDYLKSKKGWNEALGINKSNLSENVAKRIQNNYYKDLEKYVIGKSKSIKKEYAGKFDKKGNWKPLIGKNNTLNPLSKRPTGHGSWDNYGDGSIQMVYPIEQLFMGPGAGILGLAGRAATKGISNLAKSSLIQGTKAALSQPIANIPGATIGNAISSGFAADALVNRLPEIPSQIAEGNYLGALENTATGVLDLVGANIGTGLINKIGKGISATPEAISNLKKFITTEAPLNLDVPVNKIDNVVDVRSKVLESVPKDAPYIKSDELLPDYKTFKTRGQSITYDEGVDLLEDMAKKYPVLQESPKVPVYYHGTTSASLPGIIKGEGLTPVGELIREGKVPLTGELGAGVAGINNSSISTAMARGHQGALDYAIGLSGKNKINVEDDLANWFERGGRESFVESPFSPDISFYDDLKNKRLTEWQNLSDAEKALVQDNYPVMFGINPTKGNAERFTIPRTDISDEVGISGKINFEEVPSIFVPKSKVAALQEQLGTKTKVLPIEDFMQDYKNADKYNQMGYAKGGVVSELTKKEIDKLIKQGFIIEEID